MAPTHRGIGLSVLTTFSFKCAPGFFGPLCESRCDHAGDQLDSTECEPVEPRCPQGYKGQHCDIRKYRVFFSTGFIWDIAAKIINGSLIFECYFQPFAPRDVRMVIASIPTLAGRTEMPIKKPFYFAKWFLKNTVFNTTTIFKLQFYLRGAHFNFNLDAIRVGPEKIVVFAKSTPVVNTVHAPLMRSQIADFHSLALVMKDGVECSAILVGHTISCYLLHISFILIGAPI